MAAAEFHDVDLSRAKFKNANLRESSFSDINLQGATLTNVNLANVRIGPGTADLILGCDIVVATSMPASHIV